MRLFCLGLWDGTIFLSPKAGLAESCWLSHEVPDVRAKNIDLSSANKLKEKLNQKIEDLKQPQASNHAAASSSGTASAGASAHAAHASVPSKEEMVQLYAKLNQCKIKAVALTLIDPFADQFIDQSRSVPVVSERSVCYKLVHSLTLSCL